MRHYHRNSNNEYEGVGYVPPGEIMPNHGMGYGGYQGGTAPGHMGIPSMPGTSAGIGFMPPVFMPGNSSGHLNALYPLNQEISSVPIQRAVGLRGFTPVPLSEIMKKPQSLLNLNGRIGGMRNVNPFSSQNNHQAAGKIEQAGYEADLPYVPQSTANTLKVINSSQSAGPNYFGNSGEFLKNSFNPQFAPMPGFGGFGQNTPDISRKTGPYREPPVRNEPDWRRLEDLKKKYPSNKRGGSGPLPTMHFIRDNGHPEIKGSGEYNLFVASLGEMEKAGISLKGSENAAKSIYNVYKNGRILINDRLIDKKNDGVLDSLGFVQLDPGLFQESDYDAFLAEEKAVLARKDPKEINEYYRKLVERNFERSVRLGGVLVRVKSYGGKRTYSEEERKRAKKTELDFYTKLYNHYEQNDTADWRLSIIRNLAEPLVKDMKTKGKTVNKTKRSRIVPKPISTKQSNWQYAHKPIDDHSKKTVKQQPLSAYQTKEYGKPVPKKNDYLVFTGKYIIWKDSKGKEKFRYLAYSGKSRKGKTLRIPPKAIPVGEYSINPTEIEDISKILNENDGISHRSYGSHRVRIRQSGFKDKLYSLRKKTNLDILKDYRGEFFLHGGQFPNTEGCIEVGEYNDDQYDLKDLIYRLQKYGKPIKLYVNYQDSWDPNDQDYDVERKNLRKGRREYDNKNIKK